MAARRGTGHVGGEEEEGIAGWAGDETKTREERSGDGTAPVGLRPQLAGLVASSAGLAGCLAAVVRVWGGAGRLWITGGAPTFFFFFALVAHHLCLRICSLG